MFLVSPQASYLRGSLIVTAAMCCLLAQPTWAAEKKTEKSEKPAAAAPAGVVVTVDGVAITNANVDEAVANIRNQGVQTSPQLREQVINELIVREVLTKEAKRLELDKSKNFKKQLEEITKNLLAESLWADYLTKHPITEQEEHAEYDRQKKLLGGGDSTPQYLLKDIVLENEADAKEALSRVQKGEDFAKVAAAVSKDEPSRNKGGEIGWVLPAQIAPVIANVVVNVGKGKLAASPIQTPSGWHVIKVEDVRDFKLPAFEETRPQLKQSVQNQRRQKFIEELVKKSEIKKP